MNVANHSAMELLVARFLDRTLPKSEWTHEAHLRVGLWHVLNFATEVALDRLRAGITQLNKSLGTPNTDRGGYHETITRFYVSLIARFVTECDRTRPIDLLAAELIERFGDRTLPLRHYSRALLESVAARRGLVEPDLLPID